MRNKKFTMWLYLRCHQFVWRGEQVGWWNVETNEKHLTLDDVYNYWKVWVKPLSKVKK